jgi:NAD(P)-dependent dehydrogenase (short-subunit alcohol dehydrogenase family)
MDYSPLTPLDGRVAVVTGGARGIGFESAKALHESGAQVIIVDINRELGPKAAAELEADFFPADLTKPDQVTKLAADILAKYQHIDIAFNNAGIAVNVPSEECTDDQWHQVININLNAVFYCCREFGKVMLKQGKGSIINTASMSGIISNFPQPQSAYNTSKAGVIMLTRALAKALAPQITVNSVAPGVILFDVEDVRVQAMIDATPMRRAGKPEEIAEAVHFFLTAPDFITGQIMAVDGGLADR